jgi:hypothetical protein
MRKGYETIFWGIFFATFHITLGWLQILPSFMGWLIVCHGVNCINEEYSSNYMRLASTFAKLAALWGFLSMISSFYTSSNLNNSMLYIIWSMSFSVIEILFVYKILGGTIEYFSYNGATDIADSLTIKLRSYLIIYLTFTIMESICTFFVLDELGVYVAFIGIIARIWFMIIIKSVKNLLS